MNSLFLCIVNMSLAASVIGVVILLVRALFKRKLPRWTFYLLWALVLARLLLPFSLSSPLSAFNALPSAQVVPSGERTAAIQFLDDKGVSIDFPTLQVPRETQGPDKPYDAPPKGAHIASSKVNVLTILSAIWACGFALLLLYGVGCYIYTMGKIRKSKRLVHTQLIDGVFQKVGVSPSRVKLYQSPLFASPVVCGLFRPKLVLSGLVSSEDVPHVIAHELTHIKRHDNFYKALATLALYIHWFNPLIWMFYHWYVTDMEASCDEAVVSKGNSEKTAYAYSLVNMAEKSRNAFAGGFLAFGECALKERVRSIMNVKKNTVLFTIIGVAIVAGLSVVFLTNPQQKTLGEIEPPFVSEPDVIPDPISGEAEAECAAARELLEALDVSRVIDVEITGHTVKPADFEALVSAVKSFELEAWSGIQKPGATTAIFNCDDGTSLMLSCNGDRLMIAHYGLKAADDRSYMCRVTPQSLSAYEELLKGLPADGMSQPTAPPAAYQPAPPAASESSASSSVPEKDAAENGKDKNSSKPEKDASSADVEEEGEEIPALLEDNPPYLRISYEDILDVNLIDWESHTASAVARKKDIQSLVNILNTITPQDGLQLTPNEEQLRLLRIRLNDGTKYDYWCYSNVMTVGGRQIAKFPALEKLYDKFYEIEKNVYGNEKAVTEWLGYMNPYRITGMTIERLDSNDVVTDTYEYSANASGEQRDTILRIAAGLKAITVLPDSTESMPSNQILVPKEENRMYNILLDFENGNETYNIRIMNSGRIVMTVDTIDYALLYQTTGDGTLDTLLANLDALTRLS